MKTAKNNATRSSSKGYNKSRVMKRAWKLFKGQEVMTFGQCLKESWNIEKNGYKDVTIEKIYSKHYEQIFNHIYFRINNRITAEEIANDVFIKANEHLSNYDVNTAKVLTWLYTIANNKIIDFYRSKKDTAIHVSDFQNDKGEETIQLSDNEETDSLMDASETNEAINRAFDGLKPKYREVAKLFFIEQKKYDEISELLDISLSNVKVIINRSRAKLQESLQGIY
ncbi:MAG: RNA polymerase sigma factor [Bacteroidota bacterium]